jgi:HemK-like putative methylase
VYEDFLQSYRAFKQAGVQDPLSETLHLFDLLSSGALRNASLSSLQQQNTDIAQLIQKRKEGIPTEYVMEQAAFMGRLFHCSSYTLIPTEETSLLVNVASELIRKRQKSNKNQTVIDMGTGCGNIAISLALNTKGVKILASDISSGAVDIAVKNVGKFKLGNRVFVFCGDLFAPFEGSEYEGKIDMVVCNPPYIPTGSLSKLAPEIIDHEPVVALDAGPYGIDFYRRVAAGALPMLKVEGRLVFEIGAGQERLVTRIIEKTEGYEDIECYKLGDEVRAINAVKKS